MISRPDVSPVSQQVIKLHDVRKEFRTGERSVTALDGLTAEVGAGQVTGLVGADGAGKTTLMRLLTGLLRPDNGAIHVLGLDAATQAQEIQASVGYMPQRFGLYEDLSIRENLDLYADLQGLPGRERKARFGSLMDFTGLGPFQARLAGQLSGGMKQKLGLACTLVRPPRLLLLDEPSVGVDPVSRRELWDIVQSLIGEGISVLWATAYLDEAARCDNVLLLNEGKLLAAGPPRSFSEPLKGQTFAVRVAIEDRRRLLREMKKFPHVVDVIIKGRDIRVLLSRHATPNYLSQNCQGLGIEIQSIEQVSPAFEDAFISLLKEQDRREDVPSTVETLSPTRVDGVAAREKSPGQAEATAPVSSPIDVNETVIQVTNLVRKFGDFTAVDDITFEVKRGEIFGLLGPNGAGKSTTFKMLCGLLPPTAGTAQVLGIDLRKAAARARGHIGYMAQKFSLYGNMSVLQNLVFFASAYGLSGHQQQKKIADELDEFDLTNYASTISEALPLGFKQRLALACAIMHGPGVLFLDEPTSGVDPLVRREFWTRINAMAAAGVTIMVTTHFLEEAEYCDRIGIVYKGRLIAMGTPEDLKDEHRSDDVPDPSLEDAFVDLIERYDRERQQ